MSKLYQVQALIAAIQQIKSPNLFLYNLFVGQEKNEKVEQFEIHTKDGLRLKAPLVGKREKGKLIENTAFTKEIYRPPMIKIYTIASADNLLTQGFGQTIYGDPQKNARQQLADELKNLKNISARTKQYSLAQLLTTGILPVQEGEEGIKYGEFNSEVLSGTSAWSHPDCDIIQILREKKLKIHQVSGVSVDSLIISPDVTADIINNKKIGALLNQTNANMFELRPKDLGEGASYVGYIPELDIKIYSFIDWVSDDGQTETPLLPDGTAILGKSKSFRCHYGAFPFRVKRGEPAQLFIGSEAVRRVDSNDSEDDELQLYSAPLIIPGNAQGWYHLKVK